jgi:hypothetical protein
MFKTAWSVRQNKEGLADLNKAQAIEPGKPALSMPLARITK